MNHGIVQSSPVQQMGSAGSSNWCSTNNMRPPSHYHQHHAFLAAPPHHQFPAHQLAPPLITDSSWNDSQELPESWSQLLLGGLIGEEYKAGLSHMQAKKLENREHLLNQTSSGGGVDVTKQENSANSYTYGPGNVEFQAVKPNNSWSSSHQMAVSASSPKSCITTLSNNMLDFSSKSSDGKHPLQGPSSDQCKSTDTGGAAKKARIQPSPVQSTFKVRKEKLGDRITALHQLVSPFGKTDTASVLLEAIGYIRFLQSQIKALSLPYLGSGSGTMRPKNPVQGERNCLFPEDPGQEADEEPNKDLRSKGLCLVPISCTLHVGSDNGADYWAPAFGANFR